MDCRGLIKALPAIEVLFRGAVPSFRRPPAASGGKACFSAQDGQVMVAICRRSHHHTHQVGSREDERKLSVSFGARV